jgi:hypothetical protein
VKALPGYTGKMTRKVVIQYNGRERGGNYGYNGKYLEAVVDCLTISQFA